MSASDCTKEPAGLGMAAAEAKLRIRLYDLLDSTRGVLGRYPVLGQLTATDKALVAAASEQLELLSELLTEANFANEALTKQPALTIDGARVAGATRAALIVLADTLAILTAELDYLRAAA